MLSVLLKPSHSLPLSQARQLYLILQHDSKVWPSMRGRPDVNQKFSAQVASFQANLQTKFNSALQAWACVSQAPTPTLGRLPFFPVSQERCWALHLSQGRRERYKKLFFLISVTCITVYKQFLLEIALSWWANLHSKKSNCSEVESHTHFVHMHLNEMVNTCLNHHQSDVIFLSLFSAWGGGELPEHKPGGAELQSTAVTLFPD